MRMRFLSLIPVFLFGAVGVPPGLGQQVFGFKQMPFLWHCLETSYSKLQQNSIRINLQRLC